MSEAVTALNGAFDDTGIATISEVPLQGMITLRGDLSSAAVKKTVKAACGYAVPKPGHAEVSGDTGVAWMSPDEVLVLCPYADVTATISKMQTALGSAHSLVVNVSDARASFRIAGAHPRDVMAKLCPVDVSRDAFTPGMFRRTRMAQVPAAFWMPDADGFQVICFRSQARYVFDLLCVAAQPGSETRYF